MTSNHAASVIYITCRRLQQLQARATSEANYGAITSSDQAALSSALRKLVPRYKE